MRLYRLIKASLSLEVSGNKPSPSWQVFPAQSLSLPVETHGGLSYPRQATPPPSSPPPPPPRPMAAGLSPVRSPGWIKTWPECRQRPTQHKTTADTHTQTHTHAESDSTVSTAPVIWIISEYLLGDVLCVFFGAIKVRSPLNTSMLFFFSTCVNIGSE